MRKSLSLIVLLLTFIGVLANTHTIPVGSVYADGDGMGINPGDTIFLEAGLKPYLLLKNFQGSAENYITIINKGGKVEISNDDFHYGMVTFNCRYFRLTGTGDPEIDYGISITASNGESNGLSLDELSSDFEIDHLEIYNTGFAGIMSKTNPKCDSTANRGNFTQYNTIFHDNYIHKTGGEGFYVGHSYYAGYQKVCDGDTVMLYPHDVIDAKIYDNIIDSTGYDGIQLGCAVEGAEVYGNMITNAGTADDALGLYYGMSGIVLGGGTSGLCYNNFINDGYGTGISVFGLGDIWVFNNVIVNAGRNSSMQSGPPDNHHPYGIFCDDRTTIAGSSFNFINNTIVNPLDIGIRMWSLQSDSNRIINNLIINPGVKQWDLNRSMIDIMTPSLEIADTISGGNVLDSTAFDTIPNPYFVSIENLDFHPLQNAPNIDSGINLDSLSPIIFDFDFKPRLLGDAIDAGAFEFLSLPDTILLSPDTLEICEGQAFQIVSEMEFSDSLYSYAWKQNDSILEDQQDSFIQIDSGYAIHQGVYQVVLSNGTHEIVSNTSEINILPKPKVVAGSDTTICLNYEGLELFAKVRHYTDVLWTTTGDGVFDEENALHAFYTPGEEDKSNGFVELSLTAFFDHVCDSVADTFELTFDFCTGIEEPSSALKVYPNPSKNRLFVKSDEVIFNLKLSDFLGNLLFEEDLNKTSIDLSMTAYNPGVYFLQIVFRNRIEVVKIIHL